MNYVANIHGNWKDGIFSHMMIYNETVNGCRHGGRQIPFDLNELKANNHAFIVQAVNEHDENEHSIGEIFLSYDQALKFTWLCSMIKYNERIKEDFSYQNKPKRFVEKYKNEIEKILLSMKKIGLPMPELIDVTHSENVSVSFIDVEKLTYMQGNVERKFDSYFYKDNEKFTINPVSVVLPLNNGEIHEFGKTEINFASFCD